MTRPQLVVSRRLWRTRELYRLRKYRFYRDKSKRPDKERAALLDKWYDSYVEAKKERQHRDRQLKVTGTSSKGVKRIAGYEGFVDHAYKPVPGERFWTKGYGHYGPDVKPGDRISRAAALRLLKRDLRTYEGAVRSAVKVKVSQQEFDALVSLCYNIGTGAFASSSVVRELNRGNRKAAANHFLDWNKGDNPPRVLVGLDNRRKEERALFLS